MSALLIFFSGVAVIVVATIIYKKWKKKNRVKLPGAPHVPTQDEIGNSNYVLVQFNNKEMTPQTVQWENRGGTIETKLLEVGEEFRTCAKRDTYSGASTWLLSEC